MDDIPLIEPVVGERELDNVRDVLDSGWMTEGPFAEQLQNEVADMVGVDHAITVTSCTTGLDLALEAYGIGPGDELIVPDFTYPATANVIKRHGAEPVLVDVRRDTYNIDPEEAAAAITNRTAALVPVSLMGHALDPGPLNELADEHDIPVIEDAAWSFGSSFDGKMVGSQFDVSVFSFHPRKALTTGEGGMITTDDDQNAAEMRTIKNFGLNHYDGGEDGFVRANATNYRMSDILAAVGVAQLEKADDIFGARREMAALYDDLLADVDGVYPPVKVGDVYHTYGSYCAYVEAGTDSTRDELIDVLGERGIESQIGTYALHKTSAFNDARRGSDLSTSRNLYHNLLTLPMAQTMTEDDQTRVVEVLEEELDARR